MKKHLIYLLLCLMGLGLAAIQKSKAQTIFSEESISRGMDYQCPGVGQMGGGVAVFDHNSDGYPDVYMVGGPERDRLYENQGNGQFEEIGLSAGLDVTGQVSTVGVGTGDINNNGYRDIFLTTKMGPNILLKNQGDGTFKDISASAGIVDSVKRSQSVSFGDVNQDGFLDIYVNNWVREKGFIQDSAGNYVGYDHEGERNLLYINNGNETFSEKAREYGVADTGCTLVSRFTDVNGDGAVDLIVGNDFGQWLEPNHYYRNDHPANAFTEMSDSLGLDAELNSMGIGMGDIEKDGDFDLYVTSIGKNVLLENRKDGYRDIADSLGVESKYGRDTLLATGWGAPFMDYDNDGDQDLFVANGYMATLETIPTSEMDPTRSFRNDGGGKFSDITAASGIRDSALKTRGCAYLDFDRDGRRDLLLQPIVKDPDSSGHALLYRNTVDNGNHWLQVRLQGTKNNRDGYGAKLRVIKGKDQWIRELSGGGTTYASQHSSVLQIGLGKHQMVDSLIVTWPGGDRQVHEQVQADQRVRVIEDSTLLGIKAAGKKAAKVRAAPNPFHSRTEISHPFSGDKAKLRVYDLQGRSVRTIRSASGRSGVFVWSGKNDEGQPVAPGVYLARIETPRGLSQTIKLILEGNPGQP